MSKSSVKALNTVRRQIEIGLASQKNKTHLNAFISAAGARAGFELEIQESVDRYENSMLYGGFRITRLTDLPKIVGSHHLMEP